MKDDMSSFEYVSAARMRPHPAAYPEVPAPDEALAARILSEGVTKAVLTSGEDADGLRLAITDGAVLAAAQAARRDGGVMVPTVRLEGLDDAEVAAVKRASESYAAGTPRGEARQSLVAFMPTAKSIGRRQPEPFWTTVGSARHEAAALAGLVIGRSKQFVYGELSVERLPGRIRHLYDEGEIPMRRIREVAPLSRRQQEAVAEALEKAAPSSDPNEVIKFEVAACTRASEDAEKRIEYALAVLGDIDPKARVKDRSIERLAEALRGIEGGPEALSHSGTADGSR